MVGRLAEPWVRMERPRRSRRLMVVSVHPTKLALALALVACALVGCGATQGTDPAPDPQVTAANAEVKLVEGDQADLILYVSNQSFDDEEVRLTIAIDGNVVVDGDFHVEDQHNWISFPLEMSQGDHEITAEADSGSTRSETFKVPGDETRFAVIDYWGEDDSAPLSWLFQRQSPGFA